MEWPKLLKLCKIKIKTIVTLVWNYANPAQKMTNAFLILLKYDAKNLNDVLPMVSEEKKCPKNWLK